MLCYGPLLDVVQLRRVAGDILARLNSSGCGYVRMIQYSAMRSRATVWPVMKIILPVSLDAEDICTPTHRLASARRARPVLLDRVLWLQASFCQSFPYSKGRWSHATSKVDSSIRSGTIMNHLSLEMSIPLGCFLVHMTLPPPVSPRATTLDTHTHTQSASTAQWCGLCGSLPPAEVMGSCEEPSLLTQNVGIWKRTVKQHP